MLLKTRVKVAPRIKAAEKLRKSQIRTQQAKKTEPRLSHTPQKARPWTDSQVYALARAPGRYTHPTEPGLILRVSPKLKAVWAYKFRVGGGEEATGTFGPVLGTSTSPLAGMTLAQAVDAFRAVKARALAGPSASLTLGQAFPRWLAEHRKKGGGPLAPATVDYYSEAYARYLKQAENKPLSEAGPDYWRGLLAAAREKSVSQARGTYWMLHALYGHFVQLGVLTENPLARDVLRRLFAGSADKKVKTRMLPWSAMPAWWAGVWELPANSRDAVYCLALTGWRHEAVLRLRWDQLDLAAGVYNVQDGDHGWKGFSGPMALSSYVQDCLQNRWNLATPEQRKAGWVFPARHGARPHMQDVGSAVQIACGAVDGLRLSPHDLRRTFATVADVVLGGNLQLIGRLLGHAMPQPGAGAAGQGMTGLAPVSGVTAGYVVRDVAGERVSAGLVAGALLAAGGVVPMGGELRAMLESRGVGLGVGVD